ncbi:MAG: hypothetical protein OEZ34_09235 [Spirochaetia bacterium]|nr:hypothetical protein [Spirochaetia bacterium]
MLNRLERILGKFAVPNLYVYLVILSAAVSSLNILYHMNLGVVIPGDLSYDNLINLVLFPFNIATRWIILAIYLYMLWIFGQILENSIGAFHFNVYMFTGIFFVTLGAFLFPGLVTSDHIYLSILFAVAYLAPNFEILAFFILPIKIKWIAMIAAALMFLNTFRVVFATGSFFYFLGFILPVSNFLLYFGRDIYLKLFLRGKAIQHKARLKSAQPSSIHKCEICGLTEKDNPQMDFRFCIDCEDHEYCMDHLHNHEHVK